MFPDHISKRFTLESFQSGTAEPGLSSGVHVSEFYQSQFAHGKSGIIDFSLPQQSHGATGSVGSGEYSACLAVFQCSVHHSMPGEVYRGDGI